MGQKGPETQRCSGYCSNIILKHTAIDNEYILFFNPYSFSTDEQLRAVTSYETTKEKQERKQLTMKQ